MKWILHTVVLMSVLLPALAEAEPEGIQAFSGIVQSNIFDPNRILPRPSQTAGTGALTPATPPLSLTLTGVAAFRGVTTAVFIGSAPEVTGSRQAGEKLADLTLVAVDLTGVTLQTGAGALRLPVGSALVRDADAGWQVSAGPAPAAVPAATAASSPAATSPVAAATGGPAPTAAPSGDSEAEIIRRLRERREKELNP